MLTVSALSAGYGNNTVLRKVSFRVSNGLTVLLGENGSGKTTLFRALSGSVRVSGGEVTLDGKNLLSLSPKERAGCISQVLGTHQTLAGITGEDLAEMAFYHKHGLFYAPEKAEKEQIRKTAREMNAAHLLERFLENMSAGERQTVELLAAVCQDTPLMLLDEPTSALDFNRTHDFLSRARSLGKQKIILASLHEPALALAYADRILLLKNGNLAGDFVPSDTPLEEIEKQLQLLYPRAKVISTENAFSVVSRP